MHSQLFRACAVGLAVGPPLSTVETLVVVGTSLVLGAHPVLGTSLLIAVACPGLSPFLSFPLLSFTLERIALASLPKFNLMIAHGPGGELPRAGIGLPLLE